MEKKAPARKRGRQKKTKQIDGGFAAEHNERTQMPETFAYKEAGPMQADGRTMDAELEHAPLPRAISKHPVKELIAKFDALAESDGLFKRVHDRVMNTRYPNYKESDEGYSERYKKIYKQVVRPRSRAGMEHHMQWWNVITRSAAEKVCEMINHLLCSGPLTVSEVDILDRCVHLLKTYYAERADLIAGDAANRNYHYKHTYFPMPNTYAYRIFISKYDVPNRVHGRK